MKHNFLKTAFVIAVLALFVIVGGSLSEATTLTTINVEMAGLEAAASMAAAIAIDPETLASAPVGCTPVGRGIGRSGQRRDGQFRVLPQVEGGSGARASSRSPVQPGTAHSKICSLT